jgi:hypothetical protein
MKRLWPNFKALPQHVLGGTEKNHKLRTPDLRAKTTTTFRLNDLNGVVK